MAEPDPWSSLEPGVRAATSGKFEAAGTMSAAISLKRIADALAMPTIPNLSPEQIAEVKAAMKSGGGGNVIVIPLTAEERIATALEKLAELLTGNGGLDAFFFTQAAYEAGQAFERGRR